jgi:hypothetical protein
VSGHASLVQARSRHARWTLTLAHCIQSEFASVNTNEKRLPFGLGER